MIRILLADDDLAFRLPLAEALRLESYRVSECASGPELLALLKKDAFDLLLANLRMPGMIGIELLRKALTASSEGILIAVTDQGSIEGAVDALQGGAQDYLVKPVPIPALLGRIRRQLQDPPGPGDPTALPESTQADLGPSGMVGCSRVMKDLEKLISKVGPADSSVLITGETGTGKELVARALHLASPRRERPYVAINCSALPDTLLESQLFGHTRGAFTGANRDHRGLFQVARDGTLFLDEIGELPLRLQPKVLRVLDAREFWPLGATAPVRASCRVLVATNRDLNAMVRAGQFREDLYFRLAAIEISVAPLRARLEDIGLIAQHLLARMARSMNRSAPTLAPAALLTLERHPWPGNVRELSNVLERAMILSSGPTLEAGDFPGSLLPISTPPEPSFRAAIKEFEKVLIRRRIAACGGDKIQAARTLGISLTSVYRKLGQSLESLSTSE